MKVLRIDDKFSVEFDPDRNDRPVRILRYGETHMNLETLEGMPNWVITMFYALLEATSQGNITDV